MVKVYSPPPTFSLNLETLFPFQLDNFQVQAIAALDANKSAVVCVPTGSGKTLVGEYAIHRALARGKRVFYTTPLKALSNQKLRDFQASFGQEQVGLLTGDVSVNRDAPVVVMTTEVFRNMLYGTPIGQVGTSLENVEVVVLDECHYMNDPSRGTVWEESIIYCPPEIQILALSATIANAGQLTDWVNRVHGPTELIKSDFRPVPLQFYFSNPKGLFPLLNEEQTKLNPRLRRRKRGDRKRTKKEDCPSLETVVEQLRERDMLPAIYFIFSRRGCDQAVQQLAFQRLTNAQEASAIEQRLDQFLALHPEGARSGQLDPLIGGIAAHHAGILPAWKELVEELFTRGLVKVVFATETLAAGINMPARTTVISSVSKRTDQGHRLLRASEFLQMAGRAGRRGMDRVGHVVCVQTRFEGAQEAAYLATQEADPLVSQFTPTYGMVLNLLQTHTLEAARQLLERSFAEYLATLKQMPEQQAIADLTTELAKLDIELAPIRADYFTQYERLWTKLKEERRFVKRLQKQARAEQMPIIEAAFPYLKTGDIVYLQGRHLSVSEPRAAVVWGNAPSTNAHQDLLCLGEDNHWYVVTRTDIYGIGEASLPAQRVAELTPPEAMRLKPGQRRRGDQTTAAVAQAIAERAIAPPQDPEVVAQLNKLAALQAQLDCHPLNQWGQPGELIKRHRRRLTLREELSDRQAQAREHKSQHWQEFLNLGEVLKEFKALADYTPTRLGQSAAAIRGDNELWLSLALMSEQLDWLEPHQFAAACCALVSEPPRADSATSYFPSTEVLAALGNLRSLRRQLFQVQRRYRVAIPIWLEGDLIGLVEQWALGVEWNELCDHTSLDEGDLVRMLRRTMDFLSQVPHVPYLSKTLQQKAVEAFQLMERFPIADE